MPSAQSSLLSNLFVSCPGQKRYSQATGKCPYPKRAPAAGGCPCPVPGTGGDNGYSRFLGIAGARCTAPGPAVPGLCILWAPQPHIPEALHPQLHNPASLKVYDPTLPRFSILWAPRPRISRAPDFRARGSGKGIRKESMEEMRSKWIFFSAGRNFH